MTATKEDIEEFLKKLKLGYSDKVSYIDKVHIDGRPNGGGMPKPEGNKQGIGRHVSLYGMRSIQTKLQCYGVFLLWTIPQTNINRKQ